MKEKLLKRLIAKLLNPALRSMKGRAFFEWLHTYSLQGLNYGSGFDIGEDGELFLLKQLKKHLSGQKEITVMDVGANVGKYALATANIFDGENYRIHCFEPSAFTYKKLKEQTQTLSRIHTYPIGLSNQPSEKELYYHEEGAGMASVYKRRLDHYGIEDQLKEDISLDTLDNWIERENILQVDLLKMDVEGHEIHVLEGAVKTLRAEKIKVIQFEFGGCNLDSKTYFQDFYYLLKEDFRLYRLMKDGLAPIEGYQEQLEVFLTTNYVAVHKSISQLSS